jgi:hypothetical protein
MKKIILSVFLLTTLLVQAQINHYFYINVENEEKFEEVFQDYWLKVAQEAVDNGGIQGWSVWKKQRKTNNYNYIVAFHFKDINQYTGEWSFDAMKATGIAPKHIEFEWDVFREDTYRIDSGVAGNAEYIVVNYSKPDDLNKQLKYEVEYITPVMKEMVSSNTNNRTSWNVQHKIYPAGNGEKFTMLSVDGYSSMADAMKSFDTEYGKDYFSGWNKVIKKVHGKKTMKQSLTNGFDYRPIYKYLFGTE